MKSTLTSIVAALMVVGLAVGSASAQSGDTTGVGEVLSVEETGSFFSLMGEHLDTVAESRVAVEGQPDSVKGAPDSSLSAMTNFLLDEYEKAQAAPQFVSIVDRAHRAVNDALSLCLKLVKTSGKSKLSFASVTACQGVGSNLLNQLTLADDAGDTLVSYTLESHETTGQ